MKRARRAVILPLVLVVLLVIGVYTAAFSFRVHADLASTQAVAYRLQTRLVAQAGIEKVKLMLRTGRYDMDVWYNNPEELHRIIVWGHDIERTDIGKNEEFGEDSIAYRFSIVADDPSDDEDFIRFGLTDEASKLNLNTATAEQLMVLMRAAVGDNEEIDPRLLVDAILDWRDADATPRGEQTDTEGEFYEKLEARPFKVKNRPFDTVEELLLVKGVTPEILYGEDYDRNGLLTDNEDDEDETFPMDNQDNALNRGLYPYLTVHSYESNVSLDNRPRVYLYGNEAVVREELSHVFEEEPGVVDYIITTVKGQAGGGGGQTGPPGDGGAGEAREGGSQNEDAGGSAEPAGEDVRDSRRGQDNESESRSGGATDRKSNRRSQVRNEGPSEREPAGVDRGTEADQPADESEDELEDKADRTEDPLDSGEGEPGEGASGQPTGGAQRMSSPAELLLNGGASGPLTVEHLPLLMDRTTVIPPEQQKLVGLININTAPLLVLKTLPDLTDEQIVALIEQRKELDAETKATTAWLVTEEVIDLTAYAAIAPFITARAQQFTIESLGYADHLGMVTRLQVVVDMVGPLAQTIYYRDITQLGGRYPIREEDLEKMRVP
jgi:type II secretory pathway component PulK